MEEVQGTTTPDMVSGYNMTLNNLTAADLVNGKSGNCFAFSNVKQTLLSRVHGPNDDLPANKHGAFAVEMQRDLLSHSASGRTARTTPPKGTSSRFPYVHRE